MSKAKNMKSVALVLITLVLFNTISIDAQDERVVFSGFGRGLYNKEWSSDGQRLAFQEPATSDSWFVANPNTGELEEFDEYPFSADLTSVEEQAFPTEDVRRMSPDGQLLLYSIPTGSEIVPYQFAIANRATQQIVETSIGAEPINIFESLDFLWGNDGLSVTIGTVSFAGTRRINSIIIPESRNLEDAVVYEFGRTVINDSEFYLTDAFINQLLAVSSTGQYVLLTAQEEDPNLSSPREQTYLVLWNPQNASSSHLFPLGDTIPELFERGAFLPLSEDRVLVWEANPSIRGGGRILFYENSLTEPIQLMEFEGVYTPKFSPNGEWFSYSEGSDLVFIRTEDLIPNDED